MNLTFRMLVKIHFQKYNRYNGSHLEERIALKKMGHILKNGSHQEIIKVSERIPHISPLTKIILLKLFLTLHPALALLLLVCCVDCLWKIC